MPTDPSAEARLRALADLVRSAEPQCCACCEGVGADHSCDEHHEANGRDPEEGWPCVPCEGRGEVYALSVPDRDAALAAADALDALLAEVQRLRMALGLPYDGADDGDITPWCPACGLTEGHDGEGCCASCGATLVTRGVLSSIRELRGGPAGGADGLREAPLPCRADGRQSCKNCGAVMEYDFCLPDAEWANLPERFRGHVLCAHCAMGALGLRTWAVREGAIPGDEPPCPRCGSARGRMMFLGPCVDCGEHPPAPATQGADDA